MNWVRVQVVLQVVLLGRGGRVNDFKIGFWEDDEQKKSESYLVNQPGETMSRKIEDLRPSKTLLLMSPLS